MNQAQPYNDETLNRLRAICLDLPEAAEQETWHDPTFRVRDRIFATAKRRDDHVALHCKVSAGLQGALISSNPDRFFFPRYVGHKGWIGVKLLDPVDWDEIYDLVTESYRLIAPKRLVALLD